MTLPPWYFIPLLQGIIAIESHFVEVALKIVAYGTSLTIDLYYNARRKMLIRPGPSGSVALSHKIILDLLGRKRNTTTSKSNGINYSVELFFTAKNQLGSDWFNRLNNLPIFEWMDFLATGGMLLLLLTVLRVVSPLSIFSNSHCLTSVE